MPKCDFNKVAKQLYWNRNSARVFSCKFPAYFQNTFSIEHLLMAASANSIKCCCNKCDNSFINNHYGHIMTRDLNIVYNEKLC